mgnify:FL=1
MSSANSRVICQTCHKSFTSNRYLLSHYKYPANAACRRAWLKEPEPTKLPPKRAPQDTQEPSNNPSYKQLRHDDASLGNQADFSLLDDGNSDDGAFDTSMLGENDVNLDKSSAKKTESSNVTEIKYKFNKYTEDACKNFCDLTPEHRAGIKLLALLSEARAPLHLYNSVYNWHLKNTETVEFIGQETLVEYLTKRYNLVDSRPLLTETIELPHSHARVNLVYHRFIDQVMSLLTDGRITDDDYLFHNDNPFESPPEEWTHVGDINTGLAYRETHKKLIKDPTKEVLLPILFYMDGAITGQFDHLPVEAVKFTLGIFNGKARDRKYTWRELGYICHFLAVDTEKRDLIRKSKHMDNYTFVDDSSVDSSDSDDDSVDSDVNEDAEMKEEDTHDPAIDDADDIGPKISSCAGQDLHAMLAKFLESYKDLEQSGFDWALRYKGKTHQIHFIPFVMFIKGDSVEHDKHCGSYTSRTQNVQQLCRYCTCPNKDTDEPYIRFPKKTPKMVQDLVDVNDELGLQAISQQYLQNAWYNVRFGSHNNLNVHGATPVEMLHWLQLGKYKYLREMFFTQTGKSSKLSKRINALAKTMGIFYKRQSYRDLPRTDFSKGIRRGKLMAHEMSGLILILCTCLRSYEGRTALMNESLGKQRQFFSERAFIKDWIMLLEAMLQMEAWLKLPEIPVFEIQRFEVKVRELMALEKVIGKRSKGMGFRTFNFHAGVHLSDDMLNFGVPNHVNSSSNEKHHKPDKTAALRTQRIPKKFDIQLSKQVHQMEVVNQGLQEISTGVQKWAYLVKDSDESYASSKNDDGSPASTKPDIQNTGARCDFFYSEEEEKWVYNVHSRMKEIQKFKLEPELCAYLADIVGQLGNGIESLSLFTEHKRSGQIFRGSPWFMGKSWRDWVVVDWGNGNLLPGQIWIFVDLREIPEGLIYEPGIYAVMESSTKRTATSETSLSEIFVAYLKETSPKKGGQVQRLFYFVDVEGFQAPTCMIPDFGNPSDRAYLQVTPRSEWAAQFSEWLKNEHEREFPRTV